MTNWNAGVGDVRNPSFNMIKTDHRKQSVPIQAFSISIEDPIGPVARELIEALCSEMTSRYGRPPSPFSSDEAASEKSVFLVARRGSEPVACGALRPFDADRAELKRMYVIPAARRNGFGRIIISALERHAGAFGYKSILLETGIGQPEAQRLYESCGYTRIPAFGPYVGNPSSICFQKVLKA
jgi:putative acetyltransferase